LKLFGKAGLKQSAEEIGQTVARGVIDEADKAFSQEEKAIAEVLSNEGYLVKAVKETNAGRIFDAVVTRNGLTRQIEFKTLEAGASSSTIVNTIQRSIKRGGQSSDIFIDARGSGLSLDDALSGIDRVRKVTRGKVNTVRIKGDGFDFEDTGIFK
jgi:hypothetical protein